LDDSAHRFPGADGTLPTVYEKPRSQVPRGGGLMASALAGTVLGKYRIVRQLGSGGMGAVYEAQHVEIGKIVAVKILGTQLAAEPKAHERFRREATNLSRLEHPHIVNVTDFGEEEGTPYLVMERLHGEDLADHIERRGGILVSDAADVMLPVCAAIQAAHEAQIIHRDLKPRNIYLAENSVKEIVPKVLDFGISRLASEERDRSLTDSGALLGTVPYLPPEHVRGGDCDARSDQYTLGVVLFECLTGRLPHDGTTSLVIMNEIAAGRVLRPRALRPELSSEIEKLVLRAMSFNPTDRFGSVFELGRALLPFASPRVQVIWSNYFSGVELKLHNAPVMPMQPAMTIPLPTPEHRVASAPTNAVPFGMPSGAANNWYWQSATHTNPGQMERPRYPTTDRVLPPASGAGRRRFMLLALFAAGTAAAVLAAKRSNRATGLFGSPAASEKDEGSSKVPIASAVAKAPAAVVKAPSPTNSTTPEQVTIEVTGAPADAVAKLDGFPSTLPLRIPREDRQRELTLWAPGYETVAERFVPNRDRQIEIAMKRLGGRDEAVPAQIPPAPAAAQSATTASSVAPIVGTPRSNTLGAGRLRASKPIATPKGEQRPQRQVRRLTGSPKERERTEPAADSANLDFFRIQD
jgi:serine/threonine protein kinase